MAELAQIKEMHKVPLPSFNKEVCKDVKVIECEEVVTPRPEVKGTQQQS